MVFYVGDLITKVKDWVRTSNNRSSTERVDRLFVHSDIHDYKFLPSGKLLVASDGGVSVSSDHGEHWDIISNGLQINEIYKIATGNQTGSPDYSASIYFGAQDNGLNMIKVGDSEAVQYFGNDGMEVEVLPNSKYVLGANQYGRLRLMERDYKISDITPFLSMKGAWVTPFTVFDDGSELPDNVMYAGYTDVMRQVRSYYLWIGSHNWENISNGDLGTGYCNHIAVGGSEGEVIYVSKSRRLYKTTNTGEDWTLISDNLPSYTIADITLHPDNPDIVYVLTGSYHEDEKVLISYDGGETWTDVTGSLPDVPVNCLIYDHTATNNAVYLGTDVGIFYKDDDTQDWVPFYHNLPNAQISDLEIEDETNEIFASTYGRGVWKSPLYGKSCTDNVSMSHDLEGFKYYTANTIEASSLVKSLSDVNLVAAEAVELAPGFETSGESEFEAAIDMFVCLDGVESGKGYNLNGVYAGH